MMAGCTIKFLTLTLLDVNFELWNQTNDVLKNRNSVLLKLSLRKVEVLAV